MPSSFSRVSIEQTSITCWKISPHALLGIYSGYEDLLVPWEDSLGAGCTYTRVWTYCSVIFGCWGFFLSLFFFFLVVKKWI
jgi:hypothetical protein